MKQRLLLMVIMVAFMGGCSQLKSTTGPSNEQLLRLPYVSSLDQLKREYFVYLPRGYESQPHKQWPVLFFLHGNGELAMDWVSWIM
jgi:poly(3-hydroxybutyrate) depolymerase